MKNKETQTDFLQLETISTQTERIHVAPEMGPPVPVDTSFIKNDVNFGVGPQMSLGNVNYTPVAPVIEEKFEPFQHERFATSLDDMEVSVKHNKEMAAKNFRMLFEKCLVQSSIDYQ